MAKAATSVTEVTVMDTPACFNATDIRSGIESRFSSSVKLSNAFGNQQSLFFFCSISIDRSEANRLTFKVTFHDIQFHRVQAIC